MLAMVRFVAMALGAYTAARMTLDRNPQRHGVLTAVVLLLVAMTVGILRPLGIPRALDMMLAVATAAAAGWVGSRSAVRRAALA